MNIKKMSRHMGVGAYLGWSIETCVSKLSFYCISFYRNIAILCAKTSRVNKALKSKKDNILNIENYLSFSALMFLTAGGLIFFT